MVAEESSRSVFKAKLEWYREILSLEPNSKVFLPFARHLAEMGSSENDSTLLNEAFDVLRRGLVLHPDFMEARLFHIELLNSCDCRSQCGAEVARLASLFLSYPDFWDAWREHSIVENESNDFTVALGFMGAILKDKTISIVQVLEAGLASLRVPLGNQIKYDAFTKISDDLNESSEESTDSHIYQDKMDQISSLMTKTPQVVPVPASEVVVEDLFVEDLFAEDLFAEEVETLVLDHKIPHTDIDIFPESHIENYLNYTQKYENNKRSAKETLATLLADTSIIVEPMETSPFQTRSMAEVLSEQGDLIGAIEIYRELVGKASGAEVISLENRLAELENCANNSKKDKQDASGLFAIDDFIDTSFLDKNLEKIEKKSYTDSIFMSGEIIGEDTISEGMIPEDTISEGMIPEDTISEDMIPEEPSLKEFTIEEIMAEKFFVEKIMPEEFSFDEFLPDEFSPTDQPFEEFLSEEFLPEELADINSTVEEFLIQNVKTEDKLLDGMSFDEFIADKTASEISMKSEVITKSTDNIVDLLNKLATRLEEKANL